MGDESRKVIPAGAIGGGVGGAVGASIAATTDVNPLVGAALAAAAGLCLAGVAFLVYARLQQD